MAVTYKRQPWTVFITHGALAHTQPLLCSLPHTAHSTAARSCARKLSAAYCSRWRMSARSACLIESFAPQQPSRCPRTVTRLSRASTRRGEQFMQSRTGGGRGSAGGGSLRPAPACRCSRLRAARIGTGPRCRKGAPLARRGSSTGRRSVGAEPAALVGGVSGGLWLHGSLFPFLSLTSTAQRPCVGPAVLGGWGMGG